MSKITLQTTINSPIETVWRTWTLPEHITKWAFASDEWESPWAENDVREGGKFVTRMQAKDGSAGFNFGGTYTAVKNHELIEYTMDDGRTVSIRFAPTDSGTELVQTFDAEKENPEEMQRQGWQAILDNYKKYVEAL